MGNKNEPLHEADAILAELLGEIVENLSETGSVATDPEMITAMKHGAGFLTGGAEMALEEALHADTSSDWEDCVLTAIDRLLMAVVLQRRLDGMVEESGGGGEPIAPPPSKADEELVAFDDFINKLIENAPPTPPSLWKLPPAVGFGLPDNGVIYVGHTDAGENFLLGHKQ